METADQHTLIDPALNQAEYMAVSGLLEDSGSILNDADYAICSSLLNKYFPFGEVKSSSGLELTQYKFTDQEFDPETGLYYYNARYYDPQIGRFISADTIVPDPMNSQAFNRYSYVINNPLIYSDPTGHVFSTTHIIPDIYKVKDIDNGDDGTDKNYYTPTPTPPDGWGRYGTPKELPPPPPGYHYNERGDIVPNNPERPEEGSPIVISSENLLNNTTMQDSYQRTILEYHPETQQEKLGPTYEDQNKWVVVEEYLDFQKGQIAWDLVINMIQIIGLTGIGTTGGETPVKIYGVNVNWTYYNELGNSVRHPLTAAQADNNPFLPKILIQIMSNTYSGDIYEKKIPAHW